MESVLLVSSFRFRNDHKKTGKAVSRDAGYSISSEIVLHVSAVKPFDGDVPRSPGETQQGQRRRLGNCGDGHLEITNLCVEAGDRRHSNVRGTVVAYILGAGPAAQTRISKTQSRL